VDPMVNKVVRNAAMQADRFGCMIFLML